MSLLPFITTSSPPVVVNVKLDPVFELIPEPTTKLSLNVFIPLVIVWLVVKLTKSLLST